ncbi:MAG: RES family NAD+ phosphorylase [Candidatus Accumulibacter sp.]|uniref:RES family NAD+ phosphorylase n=2 Tax=Candidatus Accumulibacter TaxID=327159 RepID=A0A935PZ92_9PROT|nr:RES family NAD+ phosphorylase [Candidatus Accumulibacter proximus]
MNPSFDLRCCQHDIVCPEENSIRLEVCQWRRKNTSRGQAGQEQKKGSPYLYAVWNAVPAGLVSADAGDAWLDGLLSALLMVPSAIVPEEFNVLLNPRHADAAKVDATAVRPWTYDARLLVD